MTSGAAELYGNNETGSVENLGTPVNTPGNEMFPTFRPNGDLYFSSDGHPGMGGLDLFYLAAGEKQQIKHLGFPMNSQGDDFGMTFEGRHNKGYFCSNRGDTRGYDHIYSFYIQRSSRPSRDGCMNKTVMNCLPHRCIWWVTTAPT